MFLLLRLLSAFAWVIMAVQSHLLSFSDFENKNNNIIIFHEEFQHI